MEKNSAKISLGTAICMFIIFLLIIALGITYYLGFVKNNQKIIKVENEKNTLENSQIVVDNQNTVLQEKQDDNSIEVNKDYTIVDNAYVVNLINELNNKAAKNSMIYELRVRDISKDDKNNKYIIIADYNNPLEITQEEYNTLVKTGDCSNVLHLTGSYIKASDLYGEGQGYGFVELYGEDNSGKMVYKIVKTDKGYAFVALAGPAYPLGTSSKKIGFYMGENEKIYVYNEGEKTLKEYAEKLKQKLSGETLPIVTVEYNNGTVSLNMSGK